MANIFGTLVLGLDDFPSMASGELIEVEAQITCQTTIRVKMVELVCFGFKIGDIVYLGKEKHQIKKIKVDNFKIIYFLEDGTSTLGENLTSSPPTFESSPYYDSINRLESLPPGEEIEPIIYTCSGAAESVNLEELRANVLARLNKLEAMQ
jgi:hypothetical protein